ncbi:MAG: flagellar motor protein MotD [Steroidobacteraceae bacterium]
MARRHRHKHEEHVNHEAWAIPYGDLITLLLAFFVVMYAISSVNQGKYRVLSDSLISAFQGRPMTLKPVQVGEKQVGSGSDLNIEVTQRMIEGQPRELLETEQHVKPDLDRAGTQDEGAAQALEEVAGAFERAMSGLIEKDLVVIRRHGLWVEVEIRTDLLFSSGLAKLSDGATQVLQQMADTIKPFPNPIRVEGHTDDVPIRNSAYQSNWELSAARAATVVHLFTDRGVDPKRLSVIGLGQYRPLQSNTTPAGRNANRRVVLVILSGGSPPEGEYAKDRGKDEQSIAAPAATPVQ